MPTPSTPRPLGFADAIQAVFRRYADFHGRAARREFWWWALAVTLANLAATLLDTAILGIATGPCTAVCFITLTVPTLAVGTRRLHDTGRSGWWLLLLLAPCVGAIAVLVLCAGRSEVLDNRYGSAGPTLRPLR